MERGFYNPLMATHESRYRILYRDIDSMGYLYYGRYLDLFEMGRVEWMREEGFRYRDMEANLRLALPVTHAKCQYHSPLRFDDLALIRTEVIAWSGTTLCFSYHIFSQERQELCATGEVELGCVDLDQGQPQRLPKELLDTLTTLLPQCKGRRKQEG